MIAAVAPAAPAVPYALLALGSAIAFVVSWGMLHGWNRTVGSLLLWLADVKIPLKGLPDLHPFSFAKTLNNKITDYLGQAVAATEHAMTTSFHRMVGIILWSAQELAGLATDVYSGWAWLKHRVDELETAAAGKIGHGVVALIHKIVNAAIALERTRVVRLVKTVTAKADHAVRAAGHAVAAPFPRIGKIEKSVKAQGKRLTRVEKALAAGVGAAFLIRALSKAGLGWLRCRNVTKAGKAVCGMNPSLLEALLLDAAALTIAFNLEEFARELQTVTGEAARLIHNFAE